VEGGVLNGEQAHDAVLVEQFNDLGILDEVLEVSRVDLGCGFGLEQGLLIHVSPLAALEWFFLQQFALEVVHSCLKIIKYGYRLKSNSIITPRQLSAQFN
jgi:hypothetical protein